MTVPLLRPILLGGVALALLATVFVAGSLASSEGTRDTSDVTLAFDECMTQAGYSTTDDGWRLPSGTVVTVTAAEPIKGTDEVRALFAANEACQQALGIGTANEADIAAGNARIDAYYVCMEQAGWPTPERIVGVDGRVTYRGGDTSAPGWAEDSQLCLASSSAR
jgi:hypothetical protein